MRLPKYVAFWCFLHRKPWHGCRKTWELLFEPCVWGRRRIMMIIIRLIMKGCGVLGTRGDGPSSGTFELVLSYWQPLGTQTGILKLFFFLRNSKVWEISCSKARRAMIFWISFWVSNSLGTPISRSLEQDHVSSLWTLPNNLEVN